MTQGWRRLHNEELQSSPNIFRVIKSRKMGKTYSTHGAMRNEYNILVGTAEDHVEDLGVGRNIISEWIFGMG